MAVDRTTEGTPLNVSGPTTTKRKKRAPGPRKDQVVIAELQLYNADGTEFIPEPGMKAKASNVSKNLAQWALEQAEGSPSTALKVIVRIPSTGAANLNAPNGS